MLHAAVFVCLLGSSAAAVLRPHPSRPSSRITGGSPANISDFPWQAALELGTSHLCGGSVISATWAMTAAHCIYFSDVTSLSVRAGTSARGSGGTVHSITAGIYHDSYDQVYTDYDLAVLQVSPAFTFGATIQPVKLPEVGSDPEVGTAVVATGWGYTHHDGGLSSELQQGTSYIISRSDCDTIYDYWPVTERMICAGDQSVVCNGDGGGPLVSGDTQLGIASWVDVLCDGPAVFANVGNMRSWISNTTGV